MSTLHPVPFTPIVVPSSSHITAASGSRWNLLHKRDWSHSSDVRRTDYPSSSVCPCSLAIVEINLWSKRGDLCHIHGESYRWAVSIDTVPLANRGRSARRHGYHLCLRISNTVRGLLIKLPFFKSRTNPPNPPAQDWLKEVQILHRKSEKNKKTHAYRPNRSIHILAGRNQRKIKKLLHLDKCCF